MRVTSLLPVVIATALAAAPLRAGETDAAMRAVLDAEIRPIMVDTAIVGALTAQNLRTGSLSAGEMPALDQAWRAEIGVDDRPTIDPVLENPVFDASRVWLDGAGARITEVFAMEDAGHNLATPTLTPDDWQSDAAEFARTFLNDAGGALFGDIEHDESTHTTQAQTSATQRGPGTGDRIGAITVGVNAEALF